MDVTETKTAFAGTASGGSPRSVSILGSTGSVGRNTVDLLTRQPGAYHLQAMTANRNSSLLAEQALQLRPKVAVVADQSCYKELKELLSGSGIEAAAGDQAVVEAAGRPVEWVMASIVGIAGLRPTLEAVRNGAVVALANKECLVSAGSVMTSEISRHGATLVPVDSEHSAIFQVFDFENPDKVERIVLTASGGPFLNMETAEMAGVTPSQAVAHPNWSMGAKISVDSATMMNKGLELIEAYHIFPIPEEKIEVIVHPQSVIHGMVHYVDGSVLAQMGAPDMRTPISYALGWPERMSSPAPSLALDEVRELTFLKPDHERFPALKIARQALKIGASAPTILNAANEIAVQSFLNGEIGFLDIARLVEQTLEKAPNGKLENIDDVFDADSGAREIAKSLISLL
ncbi:MAG: 1-deoxy-D-xylulose-5-phosphate reductoisomerase [Rhodospirillales bacterium]